MRVADYVLKYFQECGVRYVFGIPAGSINAIYDTIHEVDIQPVIAKHEAAAGFMAAAYARESGEPAVCLGSSGPGATNLVTAAAHCHAEKLPVIFITGAVPTAARGKGGAQELDAVPIYQSITRESVLIDSADKAVSLLPELMKRALDEVPGPVHMAIPLDIQMKKIKPDTSFVIPQRKIPSFNKDTARSALKMITGKTGCIFVGKGAKKAKAELIGYAEQMGWPVVTSPAGKGTFPEDHPLSYGVYGLASNSAATRLINKGSFDVLLVAGSSLGEAATSGWNPALARGRTLIHVDIDPSEFHKNYQADVAIQDDVKRVLQFFIENGDHPTVAEMEKTKTVHPGDTVEPLFQTSDSLSRYVHRLQELLPHDTFYHLDIGGFMNYFIRDLKVTRNQSFNIELKFGSMGSGIASSIGGKLANPQRTVVTITGDGCFYMHGNEILTARELGLPVLFVIVNDARLGMVHHGHLIQYNRSLEAFSQRRVNISSVTAAWGIASRQVQSPVELTESMVSDLISQPGPSVLEIVTEGNEPPPMGERVKFLQSFQ
ncbi:MAG: thiamine pyrophosphate-binding protein [Bacillaceae bacterium]|nr:thiamine pyrophosphate-binding protein [Bacillaceae bacterium]